MPRSICFTVTLTISLWCTAASLADNWSSFRGKNGQGISPETNLPLHGQQQKISAGKLKFRAKAGHHPLFTMGLYILRRQQRTAVHAVSFR